MKKYFEALLEGFDDEQATEVAAIVEEIPEGCEDGFCEDWPDAVETEEQEEQHKDPWISEREHYRDNLMEWLNKNAVAAEDLKNLEKLYFIDASGRAFKMINLTIAMNADKSKDVWQYAGPYNHNVVTDDLKDYEVKFVGGECTEIYKPYGQHDPYSDEHTYASINSKLADPSKFDLTDHYDSGPIGTSKGKIYKSLTDAQNTACRKDEFLNKYGMDTWYIENADYGD